MAPTRASWRAGSSVSEPAVSTPAGPSPPPPAARAGEVDAAHDRGDPGQQLLLAERLDEVVVRADPERLDLGRLGALAGHDEHGHVAGRAQLADDREPVGAGHREVEQHEVRPLLAVALDRGQAVVGRDHLVALGADQRGDRADHRRVVVHHQDPQGSRADHRVSNAFMRSILLRQTATAAGRARTNRAPPDGAGSHHSRPPIDSASRRAAYSPIPDPRAVAVSWRA